MKHSKDTFSELVNKLKSVEQIRFIDGTFNTKDASEILLAVLGDKIKFHSSLLLSNIERFGVDTSNSEQRVKELRAERERIIELMQKAKESNNLIKINSTINIELISK